MKPKTIREVLGGRELARVETGQSVSEAAHVLDRLNVGTVVVLSGGRLSGILSERDIIRKCVAQGLAPETTPVEAVMTAAPHCVGIDEGLAEAFHIMRDGGFRHVPVVEGERVVGLISIRDIPTEYRAMLEQFEAFRGDES